MTTNESFDRRLSGWLAEESERRVPDHLTEVLVLTAATRQRPAWSSLERWLPMDRSFAVQARIGAPRWAPIALVGLLLLLLAHLGSAIAGLAKPHPLPGLGLASNGLVAWSDGPEIRVASANGSQPKVLVADANAIRLRWSVDGTRLAFRTAEPNGAVMTVRPDGSDLRTVSGQLKLTGDDDVAWSPDGSRLVFATGAGAAGQLVIAEADGSGANPVSLSRLPGVTGPSHAEWSPDGKWISFFATGAAGTAGLYVISPDGTSGRLLSTIGPVNPSSDFGGGDWAPTTSQQWLVYVAGDNQAQPSQVYVYDVATSTSALVGTGFWPSWSRDGTQLAAFMDGTIKVLNPGGLLTNPPSWHIRAVQPLGISGTYCAQSTNLAGKAICAIPAWSPDDRFLTGADMVGGSLAILSVDGSTAPVAIPLDHPWTSGQ
ncbi:MAG TPA: hypothetical protein VET90_02245, partial [Candidatus Binatus sp.]|nr:hypothetical protein [Candidatus Binatus sp.]